MAQDQILAVSKTLGLPVKKIHDIIFYLRNNGPTDNNVLVQQVGVSKNVLNQLKRSLADIFEELPFQTKLSLEGEKLAKTILSPDFKTEEATWQFFGSEKIDQLFVKHQKMRQADRQLDQFIATSETVARRASLMDYFGDLAGKKVLFLGDDDFTSVAVATIGTAEQIDVLEIDPKIIENIQKVAKIEKLSIKTQIYDARELLPEQFTNQYDVIFIDPPYTTAGVSLFLSRAIQALDKSNQAGRIYLCFGNSDRANERFLPIYNVLADSGLMIRWVFDKFNRYEGATSIGSASSLFICDVTPKTKPLIKGKFNQEIYTNE